MCGKFGILLFNALLFKPFRLIVGMSQVRNIDQKIEISLSDFNCPK